MLNHEKQLEKRRRFGMSLIEMMVVVSIIGVLIALLLPAIQAVRNSAKKVQNQNNMRQILIALHNYVSEHNGNLPQASGWPGEGCHGGTTTTTAGTAWKTGWTQTTTGCAGTDLVSKVVSVYTVTGTNWWQGTWATTNTYNPANTRIDWTEGTPFFLLLPYTEYKVVYDNSYGPMSNGTVSKAGEFGSYHCDTWGCCDYYGGQYCTHYAWAPEKLTDANSLTSSMVNYGWQGGRMGVPLVNNETAPGATVPLIKTYLGVGDPTADYPGMLAPLSYPMLGNFTGLIDNYNTSYQGIITEAYAGCTTGSGGYNSWAAGSSITNTDFLPPPMTPGYSTVGTGSLTGSGSAQFWTGLVTADTQCEILAKKLNTYGNSNNYTLQQQVANACSCASLSADTTFTSILGLKAMDNTSPPACTTTLTWSTYRGNGTWAISSSWYGGSGLTSSGSRNRRTNPNARVTWTHVPASTQPYPSGWCTTYAQWFSNDPECHIGEWYYTITYPTRNKNYWLDHPDPVGCSTSEAMSMVPGSLNIGFLDGSVHSVNKDISFNAWNAILSGNAATDDVDNW